MNVIIDYGDGSRFAYGKLCYYSNTVVVVAPDYTIPNNRSVTLRFRNPNNIHEMVKFDGVIKKNNQHGMRVEGKSEIELATSPESLAIDIINNFDKSVTAALVHPALNMYDTMKEVAKWAHQQTTNLTAKQLNNITMFHDCLSVDEIKLFWDLLFNTFGECTEFDKLMDFILENSNKLKKIVTNGSVKK